MYNKFKTFMKVKKNTKKRTTRTPRHQDPGLNLDAHIDRTERGKRRNSDDYSPHAKATPGKRGIMDNPHF